MKVFIFAVFFVSMVFAQSNWCSISSCSSSKPHIACNHTGAFNKSCISPCAIIFTTSQVKLIVDGHNSYRDLIASGKMLPKFSAATRMAKMAWDPQLAQFADLNTKQCMMKHDLCRNTDTFKMSGQNLAVFKSSFVFTIETTINKSLSLWFNENVNATSQLMVNLTTILPREKVEIGHFTAMVAEKNTRVGCGLSNYKTATGMTAYLFACNYARTNKIGCPVYANGTSGSACKAGKDTVFTSLCKSTEVYDPNSC